jgi:hypothetical protein
MGKRTLEEAGECLKTFKRVRTSPVPHKAITPNVSICTSHHIAPFLSPVPPPFYLWPPFMFPCHPWTWPPLTHYHPMMPSQMHMPQIFAHEMQAFQLPSVPAANLRSPDASNLFMSPDNVNLFDQVPTAGGAYGVDEVPDYLPGVTPLDANIWNMDNFALDTSAGSGPSSSEGKTLSSHLYLC